MKILKYINRLMLLLLLLAGVTSCSDEETEQMRSGYGYVQFHLASAGTRTTQELEYLSDAKKIEVTLLNGDNQITQSLNLTSVDGMGDYGLTSEKLELLPGEYKLQSYTLYGNPAAAGEDLEVLMQIDLDELIPFQVSDCHISEVDVDVRSIVRGDVSFLLTKDLSVFDDDIENAKQTSSRVIEQAPEKFNYNQIEEVEIYYRKKGTQQQPFVRTMKVYPDAETGLLRTDTIPMEAKEYEITQLWMYAEDKELLLLAQDMNNCFVTVTPNETISPELPIVYSENNAAIKDYITLYNIWNNMGGEEWSYYGENAPIGANWRFKNRPVDEWGIQPCVTLNNAGRVIQLDLGGFNPKGAVPESLCELSDLEVLYLGSHLEEGDPNVITDEMDGIAVVDMWKLNHNPNYNFKRDYMDVFRARMALTHPSHVRTDLATRTNSKSKLKKYLTPVTYDNTSFKQTNRITALPKNIGKLKNLRSLFIANGLIAELPASFAELSGLEECEIYNCTKMTEFPAEQLKGLNLVVLNFSFNTGISNEKYNTGLKTLFTPGNAICKTLQLLYLRNNLMVDFPTSIANVEDLRMLDMSRNRLTTLPDLARKFRPVQAFFSDNSITSMSDNFCTTDDIEELNVSNNRLTVFPNLFKDKIADENPDKPSIYPTGTLDFSYNKINRFAEGFNGVKTETLVLTSNKFNENPNNKKNGKVVFPDALSETKSVVQYLQIANCGLDSLSNSSVQNLKQLVALDCLGNRLRYIPDCFNLEVFPYLTGVDLSNNAFSQFPTNILNVQALSKLLLASQFEIKIVNGKEVTTACLKKFPANLGKHIGLRYLALSGNDIQQISETDFPTQLAELDVTENPNLEMTIPSEACTFIQMGRMIVYFDEGQLILGCPALTDN